MESVGSTVEAESSRAYFGSSSLLRRIKSAIKSGLPDFAIRLLARIRARAYPPKGYVQMGDLRRLTPISRHYGFDRGRPIDRYYIEGFLARESSVIRGRVLEIGDAYYTNEYGGSKVMQSDVLHVVEGNHEASFIGNLSDAPQLPSNAFDCLIVTQTLQLIYDLKEAVGTIHRILKPGGTALITIPGITQLADDEWNGSWHWSFTKLSAQRLFESYFSAANIEIHTNGNVLSTIAFLHGLCEEDLTEQELNRHDSSYQLVITVKAVK